jgi:prepilin-type N-terminal cleavage/methylation domain-containing protein
MSSQNTITGGTSSGRGGSPRPGWNRRGPRGFTLMEAMLAVTIVGTGILASLQLFEVCTGQSRAAHQATTARMLAENIRETMAALPFNDPATGTSMWGPEPGESEAILSSFDDVDDFDGPLTDGAPGTTFNPPIDATREIVNEMPNYAQHVTVMPVNPDDPSGNADEAMPSLPKTTYTGAVRVRVRIRYRSGPAGPWSDVYTTSWVRAND